MRAPRVVVLDDFSGVAEDFVRRDSNWRELQQELVVDVWHDHAGSRASLATDLLPYDVVVVTRERTSFPAALLRSLPRLSVVITKGMRNDAIDIQAAKEAGIAVLGTEVSTIPTAELVWAMVLEFARKVSVEDASLRSGVWQANLSREIEGGTLGLVGLGRIGRRVAEIGHAFRMNVLAWSPNIASLMDVPDFIQVESKEALLSRSDFVSLHLRLGPQTTHIIGEAELRLMRQDAYLINTARAGLVDTTKLLRVLTEGGIAGAAVDVFDTEPLPPDAPIRFVPNVILTPHIGYVTDRGFTEFLAQAHEAIARWMLGELVRQI